MDRYKSHSVSIGPLYTELCDELSALEPASDKALLDDVTGNELDPQYRLQVRASCAVWALQKAHSIPPDVTEYIWRCMVLDESPDALLAAGHFDGQEFIGAMIAQAEENCGAEKGFSELQVRVLRRRFGIDGKGYPQTFEDIEKALSENDKPKVIGAHRAAVEGMLVVSNELLRLQRAGEEVGYVIQEPSNFAMRVASRVLRSPERMSTGLSEVAEWLREKTGREFSIETVEDALESFEEHYLFNARSHLKRKHLVSLAVLLLSAGVAHRKLTHIEIKQQLGFEPSVNIGAKKLLALTALKKFVQEKLPRD